MLWYSWAVSEIYKKHFQGTASTPAVEVMEIWQLLYMTWKKYACLPLLYSCLETMQTFFSQINTVENSNISFWCLQNCATVSKLKIQFLLKLARATLLQWKRSYLKFRIYSSQSLSMKQELVEYWWATLKNWGENPRDHFCYQER